MKIWQLALSLFGIESKSGPVPSLPKSPSVSKKNSKPELPTEKKMPNKTSNALENLVKIALSQVGVKESGGNNNGPEVRKYQSATELKPASWPWCAAFTGWIIREWLKDKENQEWLSLKTLTPEQELQVRIPLLVFPPSNKCFCRHGIKCVRFNGQPVVFVQDYIWNGLKY